MVVYGSDLSNDFESQDFANLRHDIWNHMDEPGTSQMSSRTRCREFLSGRFEPTRGVDSSEDLRGSAQITTLTDRAGWVEDGYCEHICVYIYTFVKGNNIP